MEVNRLESGGRITATSRATEKGGAWIRDIRPKPPVINGKGRLRESIYSRYHTRSNYPNAQK